MHPVCFPPVICIEGGLIVSHKDNLFSLWECWNSIWEYWYVFIDFIISPSIDAKNSRKTSIRYLMTSAHSCPSTYIPFLHTPYRYSIACIQHRAVHSLGVFFS